MITAEQQTKIRSTEVYIKLREKIYVELLEKAPGIEGSAKLEGWLDEMLLNFFVEMTKKVGELFLLLTDSVKNLLLDLGMKAYKHGVDRLNVEPPLTMEKVIGIAGDATADSLAETVIITSGALAVQAIPFINLSGVNEIIRAMADITPDLEIAKVVTKTMTKAVVGDPIQAYFHQKYRPHALSIGEAEDLVKKGIFTFQEYADTLAALGYSDDKIQVLAASVKAEMVEKTLPLSPPNHGEIHDAYLANRLNTDEVVKMLLKLKFSPERILLTIDNWNKDKAEKIKKPALPPTAFQILLHDMKLVDEYDGELKKWANDIEDLIKPLEEEKKEIEKSKDESLAGRLDEITKVLSPLRIERRSIQAARRQIQSRLSQLRKTFAQKVADEADAVLKQHAEELAAFEKESAVDVKAKIPAPVLALQDEWTRAEAEKRDKAVVEFVKDEDVLTVPLPVAQLNFRGTDLSDLFETGAKGEEEIRMQVPTVEVAGAGIKIDTDTVETLAKGIKGTEDFDKVLEAAKAEEKKRKEEPIETETVPGELL